MYGKNNVNTFKYIINKKYQQRLTCFVNNIHHVHKQQIKLQLNSQYMEGYTNEKTHLCLF